VSRRRLIWQLFPSYLVITLVSIIAIGSYASSAMRRLNDENLASSLRRECRLIEDEVKRLVVAGDYESLDRLAKERGGAVGVRITVILPSGVVVADTEATPATMNNHRDRPEVSAAYRGETGSSVRYSQTVKKHMMYVAVPLELDDALVASLRMSLPVSAIEEALARVYTSIAIAVIIIAVIAALVSFAVSRRISRPLGDITVGARRFASGDLNHKLRVPDSEEIGALAQALNEMAGQLDNRIETVLRQRNELKAVLTSMVEGVVAVDSRENILSLNQAAGDLLGVDPAKAQGRGLREIIRNSDLQSFVAEALSSQEPVETQVSIQDADGRKHLQIHGTILRDAQSATIGAVIVLNDVTRLRQLEMIRRDFVANVSHEIRTPITSIKGFVETLVETLQEGALENREDAEKFLGIIGKQADRLAAIVTDLLLLSRVEEGGPRAEMGIAKTRVADVVKAAVEICSMKASQKNVTIAADCAETITAFIAPALFEQALVNLIDNAVKYSDEGAEVRVQCVQDEKETLVHVRDTGCGIEIKHVPRLFERFYRVDKARSRSLGGTGLGLAIVKHIAQAHGGYATVESTPGRGSTFTIHLPLSPEGARS
jgi:two-component system phosphate regulon sensor histidine kinase PhoR